MDDEGDSGGTIRIRRQRPRWRRVAGSWWVRILAVLVALVLVAWMAIWLVFARDLPSTDKLLAYEPPLPTNIRAYDGSPIYTYARERRVELSYAELPPMLVDAFVSAEDKTFFTHHGVNPLTFVNGAFEYVTKFGSGERARGGSTITQQVAKNLLTGNEYSVKRKVREAILAMRIERTLSKQQIMEIYLNQIFLGRNAYGVEAAAQAYFGKDVRALTLPEMAYLAILPKAPSNYTPEHDMDRALARRAYVLREMQRQRLHHRRPGAGRRGDADRRRTPHLDAAGHGGELLHRGGPPRVDRQVRRDRSGRPLQRLCRRAVGPHLVRSQDAGRDPAGAARRAGALRQRPRLVWPDRAYRAGRWLAGPAARRQCRHRLCRLEGRRGALQGQRECRDRA